MKIALCCQGEARHDLNTLISSGFEVDSTNRVSGPLDTPSIKDIQNNVSGQLTVRGNGVLNGRVCQVQASTDGGKTYTDMGNFNGARLMLVTPTTPGATYTVQFCALGGSTGQSAWSNPVSIMASPGALGRTIGRAQGPGQKANGLRMAGPGSDWPARTKLDSHCINTR